MGYIKLRKETNQKRLQSHQKAIKIGGIAEAQQLRLFNEQTYGLPSGCKAVSIGDVV